MIDVDAVARGLGALLAAAVVAAAMLVPHDEPPRGCVEDCRPGVSDTT